MAEQPQWIVDRLANRHLGITAKHKTFPPAIGEITDMIGSLHEMEERSRRYSKLQERMPGRQIPVLQPFRPFPRLWEAFAGEPEVIDALDHSGSFDRLSDISRVFATRGKDAARRLIIPQADLSTDEDISVASRATSEKAA